VIRDADIDVSDQASGIEAKAETQFVVYQDHSRIVDSMDSITDLRPLYRAELLDDFAPYRRASALGRWDAEYGILAKTSATVAAILRYLSRRRRSARVRNVIP
jgi:hypothetical protein